MWDRGLGYFSLPDFLSVATRSSWHLSQAALGDRPPVSMSCMLVPRLSARATNSGTGARIHAWNAFLSTRSSTVLKTGCACCRVGSLISDTRGKSMLPLSISWRSTGALVYQRMKRQAVSALSAEMFAGSPSTQPPNELRAGSPDAAGQGPTAYLPTIFDLVGSSKKDTRPNQVNVIAASPCA